jgi:hypothetical protein
MPRTFLYRCPNTGQNVQGWSADEVTDDDETYQVVPVHRLHPRASGQSEKRRCARRGGLGSCGPPFFLARIMQESLHGLGQRSVRPRNLQVMT